jgi:diguanylate cyclase (GGDEF)-like protein
VDAADGGRGGHGMTAAMLWYGGVSLGLTVLHPFLAATLGAVVQFAVFVAATVCVGIGRQRVIPGRRLPWTLLLCSFVIFSAANLVLSLPGDRSATVGRLIDTTGYFLLLFAALAFVARSGARDLGGVIDAVVMALAVGGVLWIVLPHRIGPDPTFRAELELFVVLIAVSGGLGALLRLTIGAAERIGALRWLQAAISLVIGGNVLFSLAGTSSAGRDAAIALLMAALTATGLFGLDPTAPRLAHRQAAVVERISAIRLVFLGLAVALIPVVTGVRHIFGGEFSGALLAVASLVVAVLVMARIRLLSAKRDQAEQTLEYQATHDVLTGLPNRRELVRRLHDEVGRGARCVLLFCDLDGFKAINDRYGHDAGDAVLVEVARRIDACVKAKHVASRLGGDEFVVLLIDVPPAEEEAARACIAADLARPLEYPVGRGIGVSIGVASADDVRDPERLIQSADRAMYRVKAMHRGS